MSFLNFAKSTGDLLGELKAKKNIKDYLDRNKDEFVKPFNEYLKDLLDEKKLSKSEVIERSNLNPNYAYQIFSGIKDNPAREKLLAIAIAMELNLDEVQYFLRYAKQGPLYPRNQWDSIIISAIEQKLNVIETNQLLSQLGETLLLE